MPINSAYCLGDVIRYHPHDTLLTATLSQYPNSIGALYIKETDLQNDFDALTKVATKVCGDEMSDTVAVHVRAGDVLCVPEFRTPAPVAQLREAFFQLSDSEHGNIVIFHGDHVGVNNACREKNQKYIHELALALNAKIAEPASADDHFCQMVNAVSFVQGKGGYSEMIGQVRKKLGRKTINQQPFAHGGEYEAEHFKHFGHR